MRSLLMPPESDERSFFLLFFFCSLLNFFVALSESDYKNKCDQYAEQCAYEAHHDIHIQPGPGLYLVLFARFIRHSVSSAQYTMSIYSIWCARYKSYVVFALLQRQTICLIRLDYLYLIYLVCECVSAYGDKKLITNKKK